VSFETSLSVNSLFKNLMDNISCKESTTVLGTFAVEIQPHIWWLGTDMKKNGQISPGPDVVSGATLI